MNSFLNSRFFHLIKSNRLPQIKESKIPSVVLNMCILELTEYGI